MATYYSFLPYLRQGWAAELWRNPPKGEKRANLDLTLIVNAWRQDGGCDEKTINKGVQLLGPGDKGRDTDNEIIIVDHNPVDQDSDFEPNYFPTTTFRDPDLLCRYNPGIADGNNLLPWLTLVVLVAEDSPICKKEFNEPTNASKLDKKQLPYIENVNTSNLPNLKEAWRWAHVQVTSSEKLSDLSQSDKVKKIREIMSEHPDRICSRLLCARRLRPGVLYNAFVVPTFKLGLVPAGLLTFNEVVDALALAWDSNLNEIIRLPYYYRWWFRTGERGDFEYLVDLLKARELTEVGKRDMDCSHPALGIRGVIPSNEIPEKAVILGLEGAVKSLDTKWTPWGKDRPVAPDQQPETLQEDLSRLLNRNSENLKEKIVQIPDVETPFSLTGGRLIIGSDNVTVSWNTSVETTAVVWYGPGNLSKRIEVSVWQKDHSLLVKDLEQGKEYNLRIESFSGNDQVVQTETVKFFTTGENPQLLPPIYGRWHAGRDYVQCNGPQSNWLDELNLDPRHRAAAGIGAEVVRRHQEALMASAWEQVGKVDEANGMLNKMQLAKEVCGNLFRRLQELPDEDFFSHTMPVHSRIKDTVAKSSFAKVIGDSRVPEAAFSPSLRRIRRPYGAIRKRQVRAKGETNLHEERNLIQRFNGELSSTSDQLFSAAGRAPKPQGTVDMLKVSAEFEQSVSKQPRNLHTAAITPQLLPSLGVVSALRSFSSNILTAVIANGMITKEEDLAVARVLSPMLDGAFNMQQEVTIPSEHLVVTALRSRLTEKINPKKTLENRLRARLKILGLDNRKDLPDKVMVAPEFSQPMYIPLQEISQEWLIPGIEKIPQNTICLCARNNRFLEAFFCSVNESFAAELLWREYPTDQRGTYFRQFWQPIPSIKKYKEVRGELEKLEAFTLLDSEIKKEKMIADELKRGGFEEQKDISPIHTWANKRLGEKDAIPVDPGDEQLILLIRGELLKKYPNAVIYAVEGLQFFEKNGITVVQVIKPGLEEYLRDAVSPIEPKEPCFPIFSANVKPDITLLGFDLKVSTVMKNPWFFVIEERVSETRFGLDVPSGKHLTTPDDFKKELAWDHFLGYGDDTYGKYLNDQVPEKNVIIDTAKTLWQGKGSASIAARTFQKPVRIVISSNKMIPKAIRER